MKNKHSIDLYFDESGTFEEGNPSAGSRELNSQLVGLIVPRGQLSKEVADSILINSMKSAGLKMKDQLHGTDISFGAAFDRLILNLIKEIQKRGWQPVRLVNREQEVYGDYKANYTNMVAELVYRTLMEKRKNHICRGSVQIIAARVYRPQANTVGKLELLPVHEYIQRLREYLTRLRVRLALPEDKWLWEIEGFQGGSGRTWPELQICDLLSNASYRNYHKVGKEVRNALKTAFGEYQFSLRVRELIERVDVLLGEQAFGLALILLLARLAESDEGGSVKAEINDRLHVAVAKLADMGARNRNIHLSELTGYVESVVESHLLCETGFRIAQLAISKVLPALKEQVILNDDDAASLDWFLFTMHCLTLTSRNHAGALAIARIESQKLDQLIPQLAGRWEYAPILIKGLLAKAVHLTDAMEYSSASNIMKQVSSYYNELSGLFSEALPEIFPKDIRSDLRGMALGAWLQAEMFAGIMDESRLKQARKISDAAISEFSDPDDKERQYQYRCQIETYAGQIPTAREFLSKSVHAPDSSHANIAKAISQLGSKPITQGFALLHWLRLGAAVCVPVMTKEGREFLDALRHEKLLLCEWCTGKRSEYPAQGIMRQASIVLVAQGHIDEAVLMLTHQRKIGIHPSERPILALLHAVSNIEVASLIWPRNRDRALSLLDCDIHGRSGAKQIIHEISSCCQDMPALMQVLNAIQQTLEMILNTKIEDQKISGMLFACTKTIGY